MDRSPDDPPRPRRNVKAGTTEAAYRARLSERCASRVREARAAIMAAHRSGHSYMDVLQEIISEESTMMDSVSSNDISVRSSAHQVATSTGGSPAPRTPSGAGWAASTAASAAADSRSAMVSSSRLMKSPKPWHGQEGPEAGEPDVDERIALLQLLEGVLFEASSSGGGAGSSSGGGGSASTDKRYSPGIKSSPPYGRASSEQVPPELLAAADDYLASLEAAAAVDSDEEAAVLAREYEEHMASQPAMEDAADHGGDGHADRVAMSAVALPAPADGICVDVPPLPCMSCGAPPPALQAAKPPQHGAACSACGMYLQVPSTMRNPLRHLALQLRAAHTSVCRSGCPHCHSSASHGVVPALSIQYLVSKGRNTVVARCHQCHNSWTVI